MAAKKGTKKSKGARKAGRKGTKKSAGKKGRGGAAKRSTKKAAKKAGVIYYYIEDESDHVGVQVPQSLAYLKKL